MEMTTSKQAAAAAAVQTLILPVTTGRKLPEATAALDATSGGAIKAFLRLKDLSGEPGSSAVLYDVPNVKAGRVILVGAGDGKALDMLSYRKMLDAATSKLGATKSTSVGVYLTAVPLAGADTPDRLQILARQFGLVNYRFTEFKSKPATPVDVTKLVFDLGANDSPATAKRAIAAGSAVATGMRIARDLGNRPANECTPTYLAEAARKLATGKKRLTVKVLSEAEMKRLGMGSLLSVSAGSVEPAKLIIMEYKGAAKTRAPVALVGKGITFDTGGISIKPSANMDEMKYDMCGAASVIGTMAAIDEMDLKANVVGIVAAAENMPSGTATKPGDIVTTMSGQTVEILNTDAEGRLVLCDALTYVERFKPKAVVDIATLTGACIVALGRHMSGLMANDDELAAKLMAAGERAGDRAWQLPLTDDYQSQIDSPFADFANIGTPGAGSVTAACFLSRFAKNFSWAHLDIAGTAWNSGANKAATGRPVPLLMQYLIDNA